MVRGVKAGELCGTIAGLPWHWENQNGGKRSRGGGGVGETRGFSGDWRGGWVRRLEGVSVPWWRGKSSRGELLREEAGQAGLTGSHQ